MAFKISRSLLLEGRLWNIDFLLIRASRNAVNGCYASNYCLTILSRVKKSGRTDAIYIFKNETR